MKRLPYGAQETNCKQTPDSCFVSVRALRPAFGGSHDRRLEALDATLIGESHLARTLKDSINTVARSAETVLITGESGTGKELIARAIHELSTRGNKTFLPVNCGALTESLLESELFGHVKGSFTGRLQSRSRTTNSFEPALARRKASGKYRRCRVSHEPRICTTEACLSCPILEWLLGVLPGAALSSPISLWPRMKGGLMWTLWIFGRVSNSTALAKACRSPAASSGSDPTGSPVRVLVSNIEDGTLQLVEVSPEGQLRSIAKASVGKAPKRVAFMPTSR